jgi:NADPH-dependent 2,4-dienoyl-CoA reductase/sulfur reductase-like enzyme
VSDHDLVVVGAGPAGMAAAIAARMHGLHVLVLDEQDAPGGQIYRALESVVQRRHARLAVFGPDYADGQSLTEAFRACGADYRPRSTVWRIDPDGSVYFTRPHESSMAAARNTIIATGALERPMPIPGWTLPGVSSCGGGQVLLKSADLVPAGRTVLAGSGPLLYLYAAQLLRAGVEVACVLETTRRRNYAHAARRWRAALAGRAYLAKGLALIREMRRAGIPIVKGVRDLRARGETHVEAVEFSVRGVTRSEPCDTLLLHQGVVPHLNLPLATGCAPEWDPVQRCFRPVTSATGESTIPGIFVAGDGAGIAGAVAAAHAGRLAALAVAQRQDRIDTVRASAEMARIRASNRAHLGFRPFIDALYRPDQHDVAPVGDDTIVCRCEEVTAGEVRRLAREGCTGPNQMKAFVRCGMGPCQGRLCGLTVAELIAQTRGVPVSDVGYYRLRSPVKPITVAELAAMSAATETSTS